MARGRPKAQPCERPEGEAWAWPRYTHAGMMARIKDGIRRGCSEEAVSLREGMAGGTLRMWLSRYHAEAQAAAEAIAKGEAPLPPSDLARAVAPVARARGEWQCEAEILALAGDAGAMWALPRRAQTSWGNAQTVTVEGIDPSKAVAAALTRIGEPAAE